MSFERPARGLLVFQCDVCFDTFELSKADGADVQDFRSCWAVMHEEGWTLNNNGGRQARALAYSTEHLCPDCSQTARADRANPFRR
jgi:hypothetical protein